MSKQCGVYPTKYPVLIVKYASFVLKLETNVNARQSEKSYPTPNRSPVLLFGSGCRDQIYRLPPGYFTPVSGNVFNTVKIKNA